MPVSILQSLCPILMTKCYHDQLSLESQFTIAREVRAIDEGTILRTLFHYWGFQIYQQKRKRWEVGKVSVDLLLNKPGKWGDAIKPGNVEQRNGDSG